jgi:hypothetical protein
MNFKTIKNSLHQLNFSKESIIVLEKIFDMYNISISQLGISTGFQRLKVYKALDELQTLSLIKREKIGKEVIVSINNLNTLNFKIKQKLNEQIVISGEMDKLISDFSIKQKTGKVLTDVEFRQGHGDFIKLFEEILIEANNCVYHFGDINSIVNLLGYDHSVEWVKNRVSNKIKTFEIIFYDDFIRDRRIKDNEELREVKYINQQTVAASYLIYRNKVALWNGISPRIVVIKDVLIVQLLKTNFDLLWSLMN